MFLVFTACMTAEPEQCRMRSIEFYEPMTQMACLVQSQPRLAQWTYDHPNWRVKRWQCLSKPPAKTTAGEKL